ncbi:low molecular weight phosphotyrosine protein phosphatase [Vibrio sp. 1733]|uniref:arsenate reductase/protein-tyrosine-phosphatase family protein n=1 Tax=unclassified Vibrio TaxID=2614977 RepID=UPI00296496D2|nr:MULTISPECIES: low molecular weight phosphotyrosine protein phosphatase [unclassified Vibrio]MDW2185685.1 low molecular weight phosphotyrosine protein phosphatase [Vibrio sp. 1733]MDW2236349.1 low molecular weight phosphotyrosine protein phosphatase [Vibrio sp. 1565-1]
MFSNILVVCVGNICRSPTGERLLQSLLPNKHVASAGIAVDKSHLTGKAADEMATTIANEHSVSLDGHEARQLTPELCAQYDLILVMEKGHLEALTKIAPEARGKTILFGQWINEQNIPDPYRQSREAFEHAYTLIEKAAKAWSQKL